MFGSVDKCRNTEDFRKLAKRRLPGPIFHYIDGAADDEITYARNTSAFDDVDLVPNVLRGVENVDLSTTIFGKKLDLPFYCSPTALQRLFHYDGERAVGKAAQKFKIEIIISIPGDCPLIDPSCVEEVLKFFLRNSYDYVSSALSNTFPSGMETQVYNTSVLMKASKMTNSKEDREHVTLFIYKKSDKKVPL